MRPILALAGTIILVVLLVLTYFIAPSSSSSQGVSSTQDVQVSIPSGATFLSSIAVTITYYGLPPGDYIAAIPCAVEGESATACQTAKPGWSVEGGTAGSFTIQINVGHSFLVTTNAPPGADMTFSTSTPFWSEETTYLLIATIVGVLLAGIGMIRTPEEKYGLPRAGPPPTQSPMPAGTRPFCENCGERFRSPAVQVCPACGTPRGT